LYAVLHHQPKALVSTPASRPRRTLLAELERSLIIERIKAGMHQRKLEGYRLGRVPLSVDHQSLVRDRLSGMSLTKVSKKYGVSRASVVRFTRDSMKRECVGVAGLQPAMTQAPGECLA
jgi:DNA invertase Pin-like site-specific DNA recombinase